LRKPKNTEKPKKKRKTENSVFADDDIYYLNYMHFSPLKLRNEGLMSITVVVKAFYNEKHG